MQTREAQSKQFRLGYTLVEMLVAIGLVMLIMILLAQVFGLATSSMEKHRATSANDQQARTFVSIFKGDLCARSCWYVYPFYPGMDPADATGSNYVDTERRGYFSINENNPNSSKDDTISFTVDLSSIACLHNDTSGLRGRVVPLGTATNTYLQNNHNQPEFDDGYPYLNGLGLSRMAEIMYFVRNGNLYRRVMLLRDAYDDSDDPFPNDGQPTNNTGADIITGDYPGPNSGYSPQGSGSFWRDFDYSAVYNNVDNKPYIMAAAGANLSDQSKALLNDQLTGAFLYDFGGTVGTQAIPLSLGIPLLRFGHDINDIVTISGNTVPMGRPKEFLQTHTYDLNNPLPEADEANYMGRFLSQENSHDAFEYPGRMPAAGNPHGRTDLTFAPNGLVDGFHSQTFRRGDEILLTNVIDMDIKVWDDDIRRFVDLGHSLTEDDLGNGDGTLDPAEDRNGDGTNNNVGHYHRNRNQNSAYGNIYDTWHPWQYLGKPPYRPISVGLDGQPGEAGVDDDNDGTIDNADPPPPAVNPERGWIGSDDEVRLKAIQLIVRYMDPQLKLVRQVTITEHLTGSK